MLETLLIHFRATATRKGSRMLFLVSWQGSLCAVVEQEAVSGCWSTDLMERHMQYGHCCEHPPGTPNFNSACFDAFDTWGQRDTWHYGICCAVRLGAGGGWTMTSSMTLPELIDLSEESADMAHAVQDSANHGPRVSYAISNNHAYTGLLRKLPAYWADYLDFSFPNVGDIRVFQLRDFYVHGDWGAEDHVADKTGALVWSSAAAWFIVGHANSWVQDLVRQKRRRLRLLDLASGLGLTTVAAAKSDYFDKVVGIDVGYRHAELLDLASANAKRNGVDQSVRFLPIDICSTFDAKEIPTELASWGPFDLVTMQQLAPAEQGATKSGHDENLVQAVSCAHRLMQRVSYTGALYLDVDSRFYLRRQGAHLDTYPDVGNTDAAQFLGRLRLAEAVGMSQEEGELAFPMDEAMLWRLS